MAAWPETGLGAFSKKLFLFINKNLHSGENLL
jgi:hypothetical protein